jgi:hypothetical protein
MVGQQGKYEIYWRKEQNGTPNQPISPHNQATTSPKDQSLTLKKGAMIAVGVAVAKRGLTSFTNEIIATTGNERLQTVMNNGMKLVGYVGAVAISPIAGSISVASDVLTQSIVNTRKMNRENKLIELNNKLRGKRANIANGRAYYD